jgi:hypothetical protein
VPENLWFWLGTLLAISYTEAVDSKQTGVIIQQNGGQGLAVLIKKGETYKHEKND